jgi:transposase-like protein
VTAHYSRNTQRLPKAQEQTFREGVEQLQDSRGGGRERGEDIRQLLSDRNIKSRINVMLGFKRFNNAAVIIAGIELMHRIRRMEFYTFHLMSGPINSMFFLCSSICTTAII